jgi:hypothetical protein
MKLVFGSYCKFVVHTLVLFILCACGEGLKPSDITSTQNLEGPLVPTGQKFALLDTQGLSMTLGTSRIITARLIAATDFEGSVALAVVRNDLNGIDTAGDIVITPVPSQIDIKRGEIKTVTATVEVRTRAPSFTNGYFHFTATEITPRSDPEVESKLIPLTVQNVYEVLLVGGGPPEVWSSTPNASFRVHTGGLKVRYVNMDMAQTHSIRGSGAVPTQVGTMARATPTGPGGTYEFTIQPTAGAVSGTYYCGTHESNSDSHTLQFNQP